MLAFRGNTFTQLGVASTSITVSVPTGFVAGDILWAFFGVNPQAATGGVTTIPAGWASLALDGSTAGLTMDSFWFIPSSTPAASYTWVFVSSATWFGGIASYGASGGAPSALFSVTSTPGSACPPPSNEGIAGAGVGFGVGDTLLWDVWGALGEVPPTVVTTDFAIGPSIGSIAVRRFAHQAGIADPTFVYGGVCSSGLTVATIARDAFMPAGNPTVTSTFKKSQIPNRPLDIAGPRLNQNIGNYNPVVRIY